MQKIKRVTGIIILFLCGFAALIEIISIQMLIEEPKDYFTIIGITAVLFTTPVIFFLVRFGLRLIENPAKNDSIDQIGE